VRVRIIAWRLWTFLRRRPWTFLVGVAMLAVELFVPRNASQALLIGMTLVVVGKGISDIVLPAIEDSKIIFGVESRPRTGGPLHYPYTAPYRDWPEIRFGEHAAVHDPRLDAELARDRAIALEVRPGLWEPAGEHEELRALKVSTLNFDEDKVRLEADLVAGAGVLAVRKTKYSAFLVTNRLAWYEYRRRGSADEYLRFETVGLDGEGRIPRFELSHCSNHVGVDVLAIAPGRVLLQRQAAKTQLAPGMIVCSGSGSADWQDLAADGGRAQLLPFVRRAMAREMTEELGLPQPPDLARIKVLGYARWTSLGGKPQFYGIAKLSDAKTKRKGIEKLFVDYHPEEPFDPHDGIAGLLRALDSIELKHRSALAFQLAMTITMVRQWVAAAPEPAAAWLGLPQSRPGVQDSRQRR
jgi:hypothetical protein